MVRYKERSSFEFNFMSFDLTVVKEERKQEMMYEVEFEIKDMKYLMGLMDNREMFHKVIQRFIENIGSVQRMMFAFAQQRMI